MPSNDLPPFCAARAENCVFSPGAVGSRPGFSTFISSLWGPSRRALGLFLATVKNGGVLERELIVGANDGTYRYLQIDRTPLVVGDGGFAMADVPQLLTGTQFYQRHLICTSGSDGYGSFMVLRGSGLFGVTRFSAPAAPTLTPNASGGACTAGSHAVALNALFTDGSEGPLGEPAFATVVKDGTITVAWDLLRVPYGPQVSCLYVWVAPAGGGTEFRRLGPVAPTALSFTFDLNDEQLLDFPIVAHQTRVRSPKFPALAVEYAGRVAYFGERHRAVAGWRQGGSAGTDFGVGAVSPPQSGAPGGWENVSGSGSVVGGYVGGITFDGVTVTRARLRNWGTVVNDLPIIARRSSSGFEGTFGVRIIYWKDAALTNAFLTWGVTGTTGTNTDSIDLSVIPGDTVHVKELIVSGTFSNDLKLFYEGVGPGVNGARVWVVALECFDLTNTSHRSTVWWSRPYELRSIDGLLGGQTFGTSDSETAWLGFEWQGRFFVAKDSSLWVTQATSDDPINWPVERVSDLIGACGRRAIGHGPDFKILVNRSGCWLFRGAAAGEEANLAKDIPAEWAAVNWSEAWQAWVAVDEVAERVYVGVPVGAATECSHLYVLDYSGGFGPAGEASGRRWSVWPIAVAAGLVGRRAGQTEAELWGTLDGSIVGFLDSAGTTDLGVAIPWTYETGRIGASDGSLAVFRRLSVNAEGSGYLVPTIVLADTQSVPLLSFTLYSPMRGTQHVLCNVRDERVALRFQLSGTGARVTLHRAALWMRRHPFGDYRPRTP